MRRATKGPSGNCTGKRTEDGGIKARLAGLPLTFPRALASTTVPPSMPVADGSAQYRDGCSRQLFAVEKSIQVAQCRLNVAQSSSVGLIAKPLMNISC